MYVHIYIYYLIIYSYMPLPDIYDGIVVLCGSIGPESFASVQQHILLLASIAIDPQQKAPLRTN